MKGQPWPHEDNFNLLTLQDLNIFGARRNDAAITSWSSAVRKSLMRHQFPMWGMSQKNIIITYSLYHFYIFLSLLDDCNISPCKKLLVASIYDMVLRVASWRDQYHSICSISQKLSEATSFGAKLPLLLGASPLGGRGVFAGVSIEAGQEVEVCPLDALHALEQRTVGPQTTWQLRPCVGFTAGSHSIGMCWDALLFWYLGSKMDISVEYPEIQQPKTSEKVPVLQLDAARKTSKLKFIWWLPLYTSQHQGAQDLGLQYTIVDSNGWEVQDLGPLESLHICEGVGGEDSPIFSNVGARLATATPRKTLKTGNPGHFGCKKLQICWSTCHPLKHQRVASQMTGVYSCRLKGELAALKRTGENRQCFDCGAADVTWASPKLGTFICVAGWVGWKNGLQLAQRKHV